MALELFLILLFAFFGYASSFEQLDCVQVVNCTCKTDNFTKIKFICSYDYGNVIVEVENKSMLTINCLKLKKGQSIDFYNALPSLDESFFTNGISLLMKQCSLPYKFSSISVKYPPIRKASFFLARPKNVSQDFFDIDSPLTDFSFDDEVIYSDVNILLNLKNLENAELNSELIFPKPLPSRLFEGNIKLRNCTMFLAAYESDLRIPSGLFQFNGALEQVTMTFGYGLTIIEDRLLSNKINLVTVKFNCQTLAVAPAIPDRIFRNSTNLETIWLIRMGLTYLSG